MTDGSTGVLKGALFTVSMRWLSRLIGVISTLILARLLMPDDFGVAAMAYLVLGLTVTLLDLGINVALIRNAQASDEHYHSAWTLRLWQTLAACALLLVASPLAGDYFGDPRVTPVIVLMALIVAVGSLENIGIVSFQKQMQFDKEFRYILINRLFGFVCTVSLAFVLRNYWALVISSMVGAVFTVIHSYVAHPMRPRWCTSKVRELFNVSQWMLLQNIGAYIDNNLHRLLVGRRDDTATLGVYSVAADVAAMPSSELLQPLNRVLFPAFVAVSGDRNRLKAVFLLAQSVQFMIAAPAAVFLSLLASELVSVLLGEKWREAIPLLQVLSLSYALLAMQTSAWYVSVTLGRERLCATVAWSQVLLLVLAAFVLFPDAGAREITHIRVAAASGGLLLQLWIVARALQNISLLEMLAGVWRPAVALAVTALVVLAVPWPDLANVILLGAKAILCFTTYVAVTWLLWWLSRRPDGAESYLADKAGEAMRRLAQRRANT